MTHPMLRKVAEALEDFFSAADKAHGEHFDAARAAVQALLEPDEGMVEAGKAAGGCADEYQHNAVVCPPAKAYRAMLLPLVEGEGE